MQVDDMVRHPIRGWTDVMGQNMQNLKRALLGIRAKTERPSVEKDCQRRQVADSGFSLVEVVCSISLMAIVVIPLMQATFTSVAASSTSREVAEIETVLQNAADRVNRAPIGCDYHVYVEAAALSKGWPATAASATYQHYVPGSSANASTPGAWEPGGCPDGIRTSGLLQLVTVTIENASGRTRRSIEVIKSDI